MKKLTIARKLGALTLSGLVLIVVVVVAGQHFTSQLAENGNDLARMSTAIRAAALADMAHDGMHAGVRLAQISQDPLTQAAAREEITEHGAMLTEELAKVKEQHLGKAVDDAVDAQADDVKVYRQLGLDVLDTIAAGEPYDDVVARVEKQFNKMEGNLPAIANAIEAADHSARAALVTSRDDSRRWAFILGTTAIVVLAGIAWRISRSIIRPLRSSVALLNGVADGDLSQRVEVTGHDEVSQMGAALNTALANLAGTMTEISHHSSTLASASEELTAVSSQLAAVAQETSAQAGVVSAAAEQVSENVAVVAAGTGEMTSSIQEISHGAQDAVSVADQAAQVAQATNDTVAKLGISSAEIGNVVKVITSIAEQTNLLALNATIEAARAGEAGKGFAVVAHEVKELASATAAATADISDRIGAIQGDAADSVRAIGEITDIIGRVGETQASIASAVEEQTATTNEIGRNVSLAADNSTEIARNISGVADAAESASVGASNTLDTAAELSRMANELQTLVGGFRC
jgi:methyl-accepting chemotaxis protein